MSVPVPLDQLADTVADYGGLGYLMSSGSDGRPRINHVRFSAERATLRAGVGRGTAAALVAQPHVSCLWPPRQDGGLSLIADGEATLEQDGDSTIAVVLVTWAVLHRPPAD